MSSLLARSNFSFTGSLLIYDRKDHVEFRPDQPVVMAVDFPNLNGSALFQGWDVQGITQSFNPDLPDKLLTIYEPFEFNYHRLNASPR
jgi:hypothetical protein